MKLQFVREMDRAELLREKNLVLVRIRDRRHDDKNFVHASLPSALSEYCRHQDHT